ncbi:putative hydrolase [Hypsibius exemplaris]|uniref:Hydrolase n=1 Tax=Hypsibius exemplaris TaxID=2072580 RepID=A0A9X6NJD3_HYPEX|nr:putative hydrolase [Hypsibius exemplaris]
MSTPAIHYHTVPVGNQSIFYRESGTASPLVLTLLLLHGFPSSSHQFRNLIGLLGPDFHIIAPDLPGFGFSSHPNHTDFAYTFDNLANVIDNFTQVLKLDKYALYVFDYGAPVGFRIAMTHPERVVAIISQNGNAYDDGLSDAWNPIRAYWKEPSLKNRETVRQTLLTYEATKWQYTQGVVDPTVIAPESYELDWVLLQRPGVIDIQLDLFLDYASNVQLYPAFHKYFAAKKPKLLAIWGKNDPFFLPAGAEAFKRDLPQAKVVLLDTGHFALETHAPIIAGQILQFLA